MRGFKSLWSNRPWSDPAEAGNHGGTRGGCPIGEKETSDRLTPKITTVNVSGGMSEGAKVGDITGISTGPGSRKGF